MTLITLLEMRIELHVRIIARRAATRLKVRSTTVWRTFNFEGLYPNHLYKFSTLNLGTWVDHWLARHPHHRYILFTDWAQFTFDEINKTKNIYGRMLIHTVRWNRVSCSDIPLTYGE
jgi:hypothetical protein